MQHWRHNQPRPSTRFFHECFWTLLHVNMWWSIMVLGKSAFFETDCGNWDPIIFLTKSHQWCILDGFYAFFLSLWREGMKKYNFMVDQSKIFLKFYDFYYHFSKTNFAGLLLVKNLLLHLFFRNGFFILILHSFIWYFTILSNFEHQCDWHWYEKTYDCDSW